MNINALNDLFPIVSYASSSDDESEAEAMDVVAAPTSAERGKQTLQQTTKFNASTLIIYML